MFFFFFFQAEDGIRDGRVTGVQTCALPICYEGVEKGREERLKLIADNNAAILALQEKNKAIEAEVVKADEWLLNEKNAKRSEERRVGKECRTRRSPYH